MKNWKIYQKLIKNEKHLDTFLNFINQFQNKVNHLIFHKKLLIPLKNLEIFMINNLC